MPIVYPPCVVMESPFSGDVELNRLYAQLCIRDIIDRGESPYASHLLLPPVLAYHSKTSRQQGISLGFAWGRKADCCAVYTDLGITDGMIRGIANAESKGIEVVRRQLGNMTWLKSYRHRL